MALSPNVGTPAFSRTPYTYPLDLSMELAELIRQDNNVFINRTGIGQFTATQPTHRWVEDSLNANTDTLAQDLASSDTTAVVSNVSRFRVGTLFKINVQGQDEVFRVTAVNTETSTLTLDTRPYGGTKNSGTYSAGSPILIIGHTKQEDWKPNQEDWTKERVAKYNYLATIGRGVTLSRRRQLVTNLPVPDELAHQTAYRMQEMMRELDSLVINSAISPNEGSASNYSSFDGLIPFVTKGGNVIDDQQDLTPSVVNAACYQIWQDAGFLPGANLFLLCSGKQKRIISGFHEAYRRSEFSTRVAGYVVDHFVSDLGFELEVVVDPWVPDDTVIIGDWNRVRIGPLQGHPLQLEELAKTGLTLEWMVSGTYTMEVRNADAAFAIIKNLN